MALPQTPSRTGDQKRKPLQVPLMYAFRDAFHAHDAKRALDERTADDERILSNRGSIRRRGANEEQLKANLDLDLTNLVNTVNLESAVDLDGLSWVRKSVLNFGLADMSHITSEAVASSDLVRNLRDALLRHEPRLIPGTVNVKLREAFNEVTQRISFQVGAEMACRPVDIPLEFVAEIDVGSGKVKLSKLAAGTG
ncbi:MAG: type VI secretion system baseplate subunit TssE [Rhodobacteraceae bacterium]|nr:type VI secretion system baseplate subunit TssE [Paracoccaceae bacterium]